MEKLKPLRQVLPDDLKIVLGIGKVPVGKLNSMGYKIFWP